MNELQATQHVIALFERSKSQSEEALESLPGIYAVIEANGAVLRGNLVLAQLLGTDLEHVLDCNINRLLNSVNVSALATCVTNLVKATSVPNLEIKLEVKASDGRELIYLWDIRKLSIDREDIPPLFSLTGTDVTALTRATDLKARMEMELATAKLVQANLFLPPTANLKNSSVASFFEPATECGGDWWHYSQTGDKISLWIGDVTGHGVPSALVVSAVNAAVHIVRDQELGPSKALSLLNKVVYNTAKNKLVMTFFIAEIDLKTLVCIYSSAAHEPMVVLPDEQKEVTTKNLQFLEAAPSAPLGISEKSIYFEQTLQLKKGDRLLLYTDGVKEVTNLAGEKWENLKFYRVMAPLASKFRGATDLVDALTSEIENHRKGTPLADDLTFGVFKLD